LPLLHEANGGLTTAWRISVTSSSDSCSVVGDLTEILSSPGTFLLFGCLALKGEEKTVELFNPARHGYHNENLMLENESELVSRDKTGPIERDYFPCPSCSSISFILKACFYYQSGAIDVFLDEPTLPISDYFNAFNLYGVCAQCAEESVIAEFDGL
jgi:hypothetical protein